MESMKIDRRQKDDFYPTPPEAVEALMQKEDFLQNVWEPACGDGAISRRLELHGFNVVSTDLNDFGFGSTKIDFLLEQKALADQVITNPPFKLANQFVHQCQRLKIRKYAMLLRLAFLEGQDRKKSIFDIYPPVRIWIFSKRLTMWRGDEERPEGSSGTTAYAWFIWENSRFHNSAQTTVGWI